jgi:long-subunit fatty acid transport protein
MKKIIVMVVILLSSQILKAQYIEDAMRYAQSNGMISARAAGLGVAFNGIADDISALYYNPAGLALIDKSEISFGLGFDRNKTLTELLNNELELSTNDAYISHFGFVAPFVTSSGNASVAINYTLDHNFDNNYDLDAFNPNNSYIGFISEQGRINNQEILDNMAYHLFLADENLITPFNDSLQQSAQVIEGGGLHNISGGFGMQLNENFSIGLNIKGVWGTYTYNKSYTEFDAMNYYTADNNVSFEEPAFRSFNLTEILDQNVSGISGSVGIMGTFGDFMRVTAGVDFPTFYEISEVFSQYAESEFDDGWKPNPYDPLEGENSYNLTKPFVYKAGISLHSMGLTFAAGVEYTDVTQMEFSDAQQSILDLNKDIVRNLVGQTKWGFGVEYKIPLMPVVARAGFTSVTSPYVADVPGATLNNVSLGAGLFLAKNVRIDGVFRWSDVTFVRSNYGSTESLETGLNNGTLYTYTLNPLTIGLQITYRY